MAPKTHTTVLQRIICHLCFSCDGTLLNSSWPSDTIWRHRFGSILVQEIGCCRQLPKPGLTYHQLSLATCTLEQFHRKCSWIQTVKWMRKICFKNYCTSPGGHPGANVLTLNVRGPSYLGLTRSISWLLMPWLLTAPGHQQPWYWLCRLCMSWSYLRKDFKYLCHINVE